MRGLVLLVFLLSVSLTGSGEGLSLDRKNNACLGERIDFTDSTISPSIQSFTFDFCHQDLENVFDSENVSELEGMNSPESIELAYDSGRWYAFIGSRLSDELYRLDFGSSLENIPAIVSLGNLGISSLRPNAIKYVKLNNEWTGFVFSQNGELLRLDYDSNLEGSFAVTNLGDLGGWSYIRDFDMRHDGELGVWYGLVTDGNGKRISLLDFGSSPRAIPSSIVDVLDDSDLINPRGAQFIKSGSGWYALIADVGLDQVLFVDFGNSLLNTPSVTSILSTSNPNQLVIGIEGLSYYAFIISPNTGLFRIDFGSDLSSAGSITALGNLDNQLNGSVAIDLARDSPFWRAFTIDRNGLQLNRIDFRSTCGLQADYVENTIPDNFSYNDEGIYLIELSGKDDFGNVFSDTDTITVLPQTAPTIDYSLDFICVNSPITFTPTNSGLNSYSWDFDGDGMEDSNQENPVPLLFPSAGTYNTRLSVNDGTCKNFNEREVTIYSEPPVPSFTITSVGSLCTNSELTLINTTDESGYDSILSYRWVIDGRVVNQKDTVFTFMNAGEKAITLQSFVPGCSSEIYSEIIDIAEGPNVSFSYENNCFGEAIRFTSVIEDPGIADFAWDFGDNIGSSDALNPTYTYSSADTYLVRLIASNTMGCSAEFAEEIQVTDRPLAAITFSGQIENLPTQFNGIDQTLEDNGIIEWSWEFEDIGTSLEQNPQVVFAEGDYEVELSVSTSQGCSEIIIQEINIRESICPSSIFTLNSDLFCREEPIIPENTTVNAESYRWSFCDDNLNGAGDTTLLVQSNRFDGHFGLSILEMPTDTLALTINELGRIIRIDFNSVFSQASDPNLYTLERDNFSSSKSIKAIAAPNGIFAFVTNSGSRGLTRVSWGDNLSSDPTYDFAGDITETHGLELVEDQDVFYAVVGKNSTNELFVLDFGSDMASAPSISPPHALSDIAGIQGISMIKQCGIWKGLITSETDERLLRLSWDNGLDAPPVTTEITIVASNWINPARVRIAEENGFYYGFVQCNSGNTFRLNFEGNLDNDPIISDLGQITATGFGLEVVDAGKDWKIMVLDYDESDGIYSLSLSSSCDEQNLTYAGFEPILRVPSPGSYRLRLLAMHKNGGKDVYSQDITITNDRAPSASILTSNNVCSTNSTEFSVVSDGSIDSFQWDFDSDSTIDSGQSNPNFSYGVAGQYIIRLDIEGNNGCTNFAIDSINIYDPPQASFQEADQSYCAKDAILLTNTSVFDGPDSVVTYQWLTASQSFTAPGDTSVFFSEAGEQPIRLTASIPGCESDTLRTVIVNASPEVAFDWQNDCFSEETQFINSTTGNGIESYLWDLGDGTSAAINEPSYTYQEPGRYPISLTATNDVGCSNTEIDTLVIHALPEVGFEVELACADQPVRFLDTTTVADANIMQWEWVFADQGSSTEQNPEFTFSAPGEYEVELTTSSNFECVGTTTTLIQVLKAPAPFIAVEQGCLGDPVLLTDNTTQDEDNPITGYLWEIESIVFDNDSVSYDFPGPGTYPVRMTVGYENLCSVTTTTNVVIEEPIAVAFEYTTACDNDFAQFIDRSVAPGDSVISRTWDFAGLGTANGPSTFFNFAVVGAYDVTLTVTTLKGCTASTTQAVAVNPSPLADFRASTIFGPPPLEVDFFNRSEGATNYLWFVEPSTQPISSEENASFTFTELGTYQVTLIAQNAVGCTDTTSQSIRVDFPLYDLSIDNIQTEVQGDKINIIVRVTNYGTIDINGFDINIDLPGGISLSEPFDQPVLHQTSIVQTLNTQLPADTPLDQICISLPATYETFADERPDNNEACASFRFTALFTDPYPNPSASRTRIDITLPESAPVVMELVSLGGQIVRQAEFNNLAEGLNPVYLDVSSLPFGIYQLRFIHQDGVTIKRVMVRD